MNFTKEQKKALRSEGIDAFLDGFRSGCSIVGLTGCVTLFLALSMCSNKPINNQQVPSSTPKLIQKGTVKTEIQYQHTK